ncbi:Lactation elevated protein 1 [Hordeum vulgare]|nr:Lactation elevated protein 1 [Hordeum vulgare]
MSSNSVASTASEVFDEMAGSGGLNNVAVEFVNLLKTNAVDIDQAPIAGFDYNELEGGVDDHDGEDEVEKVDEGRISKCKQKKGALLKNAQRPQEVEVNGQRIPIEKGSLTNMNEDEDDDGPRNLNKPDDDKKTKEKIKRGHKASSLRDKIDVMVQSNEVMLVKSSGTKIELAEKKAREKQERWKFLKDIHERRAHATEKKIMSNLLTE